jgi:hypothetical protein
MDFRPAPRANEASMRYFGLCPGLMHALDRADQGADIAAAKLRIGLMNEALRQIVNRAAGPVLAVVEKMLDMSAGIRVDGPQVVMMAALGMSAMLLGFGLGIHVSLLVSCSPVLRLISC